VAGFRFLVRGGRHRIKAKKRTGCAACSPIRCAEGSGDERGSGMGQFQVGLDLENYRLASN
jgi:hypothetical protein